MNRGFISMVVGGVVAYLTYRLFRSGRMPRMMNFTMNMDVNSMGSRLMRMLKRNLFMGKTVSKVMTNQLIRQLRTAK